MKANAKFVTEEEAVSPVIAVILMVAITVVLAATVFVLVSDIGGQTGGAAPSISWSNNEAGDRLQVTSAAQNADWQRLTLTATGGCGTANEVFVGSAAVSTTEVYNVDAATDGEDICAGEVRISDGAAKIAAGDFLNLCGTDGTSGADLPQVQVRVTDTTANSVVHTYTFTDIAACV